jgi:hypothetical protein
LQAALDQLRAGQPAQSVRHPLRPEAAPDSKADVQLLVESKIVSSTDYWLANAVPSGQVDGPRAAELTIVAARKFKPAANLDEAMDALKQEGILSSVAYWRQHAVAGKRCSGANVARLINKLAQRLKAK